MADDLRMFVAGERTGSKSGVGRVGGRSSMERLTEPKTIVVHMPRT